MREDYEYTSEALLENIFYYMEQLATEKDFIKNIELLTNLGKYIVNAERASFWYRDTEKNEYRTLVALGADCIIVPKGRGIVGEVIEYNEHEKFQGQDLIALIPLLVIIGLIIGITGIIIMRRE